MGKVDKTINALLGLMKMGWPQREADQLAELVLSLLEGLRQGRPVDRSVNPENRVEGVGLTEETQREVSHQPVSMY